MSEALSKWAQAEADKKKRRSDQPKDDGLKPQERKALWTLRKEAKENGSYLASGGKGGLPPSFVLGIMRRDGYACKACGEPGDKDNGGISLHHKGGIVESKWLSKKGHSMDRDNVVTICKRCHDRIHEQAREDGTDSSQVTPEGDEGDPRRDHGLPAAHPNK